MNISVWVYPNGTHMPTAEEIEAAKVSRVHNVGDSPSRREVLASDVWSLYFDSLRERVCFEMYSTQSSTPSFKHTHVMCTENKSVPFDRGSLITVSQRSTGSRRYYLREFLRQETMDFLETMGKSYDHFQKVEPGDRKHWRQEIKDFLKITGKSYEDFQFDESGDRYVQVKAAYKLELYINRWRVPFTLLLSEVTSRLFWDTRSQEVFSWYESLQRRNPRYRQVGTETNNVLSYVFMTHYDAPFEWLFQVCPSNQVTLGMTRNNRHAWIGALQLQRIGSPENDNVVPGLPVFFESCPVEVVLNPLRVTTF